jgi:uncharacterized membrane protein
MEFNVYVKFFDTIKEVDVMQSYPISQVKTYILTCFKLSNQFELYYNSKKIKYGTILSNNITEDTTIILAPIMMTGKSIKYDNEQLKFDSLESVKEYIKSNFSTINDSKCHRCHQCHNCNTSNELSADDIEQNKKTMEKLKMLRQKYRKVLNLSSP